MIRSRPRRRPLAGLTRAEHHFLRYGSTSYIEPGYEDGFVRRGLDGEYGPPDLAAARRAWAEHRDDLLAETRRDGLIPWAARHFEGMPGDISVYEHLRAIRDPEHRPRSDA